MTGKKSPQRPHIARGPRRRASIESVYQGILMRSLFEVQFAQKLDQHAIRWEYEPERIGGGRYLIDFYLPDHACWVEVKGRFEARDDLLLPLAATRLKHERGERLFLYMKTRAYRVDVKQFVSLTHAAFWEAIQEMPDSADTLRPRHNTRTRRRPWERE